MGDNGSGQESPVALEFEGDPGSGKSKWVAAALIVALVVWMGSGFLLPPEQTEDPPRADETRPVTVAVRDSTAEQVQQFFRAEGQAEPERDTHVRSALTGEVVEIHRRKGADMEAGELIARIESAQREAELERAEQEVARARRNHENALTLLERGAGTVDRVAETRTALAAAEAQLSAAREALEDTAINAPFDGRLESLEIETGEFVQTGTPVARVVDLTPLTVTVQVPQQSQSRIRQGQEAEVRFITGEVRAGTVAFVGSSADPATRTFVAEIEVANEDRAVPAGVSAQVRIPTLTSEAHFVSPATLSLDASGRLGVKIVADDDTVVFRPVEVIQARTDGIWVSGLPRRARIITVGQGFVGAGETVVSRPEEELGLEPVNEALPPRWDLQ